MSEIHKSPLQYTVPVEISKKPSHDYRIQADIAHGIVKRNQKIAMLEEINEKQEVRIDKLHLDSLTGLPNRHMLDLELPLYLGQLRGEPNSNRRIGLAFLDVNEFKKVNDTFGHNTGDAYLKEVSLAMQEAIRLGDRAYRNGGDEFIMLLLGSDIAIPDGQTDKVATAVADRLKSIVGERLANKFNIDSGVSVGVVFSEPGDTPESLIGRADVLMYQDKAGLARVPTR